MDLLKHSILNLSIMSINNILEIKVTADEE